MLTYATNKGKYTMMINISTIWSETFNTQWAFIVCVPLSSADVIFKITDLKLVKLTLSLPGV